MPGGEDTRPSDAGSALPDQDRREAIRFRRVVLIGRVRELRFAPAFRDLHDAISDALVPQAQVP